MIVTEPEDILRTEWDVSGPGWNSSRLLQVSDGMGFSLTDAIIAKAAVLEPHYSHHREACNCIEDKGRF